MKRVFKAIVYRIQKGIAILAYYAPWIWLSTFLWRISGVHFKGREIRPGCMFDSPSKVYIGKKTFVNYRNTFHTSNGATIRIGDYCDIAPDCMFICTTHTIGTEKKRAGKVKYLPITIGNGCWIGTRVIILPGVSIGNGCVIAAGSVVTKNFPDNCLLGGVPSKVIRILT